MNKLNISPRGGVEYVSPRMEISSILIGDSFATSINATLEEYEADEEEFNWKK